MVRAQIAGETEVKAQIKCRLRTAKGSPMIVNRNFMLTQQKTRQTFKTLDGSIQTMQPETNELVVISHKCSEMDKLVPWIMQVGSGDWHASAVSLRVVLCSQARCNARVDRPVQERAPKPDLLPPSRCRAPSWRTSSSCTRRTAGGRWRRASR